MASVQFRIFLTHVRAFTRANLYVGTSDSKAWFAWLRGIQEGLAFRSPEFRGEMERVESWLQDQHQFGRLGWYGEVLAGRVTPESLSDLFSTYATNVLLLQIDELDEHPYDY
jgi:hypothetical protein